MAVNLVSRAQKLLMSPNTEWDFIDKEPADIAGIITTYVLPLAAIGPIVTFLATVLWGAFSVTALLWLAIGLVLAVAQVYVLAFIIDALAPTFGGTKNFGQAFKVSAYAPTAAWIVAVANILPLSLWVVTILVLLAGAGYSLYLLFLGLPKLMKPAADKAIVYVLAVIGIAIVLAVVIGFVMARLGVGGMGVASGYAGCVQLAQDVQTRALQGQPPTVDEQQRLLACSQEMVR